MNFIEKVACAALAIILSCIAILAVYGTFMVITGQAS